MDSRVKFFIFWILSLLLLLLVAFAFDSFELTGRAIQAEFSANEHTKDRANSYDDAWDDKWKETVDKVLFTTIMDIPKTEGKFTHIVDLIRVTIRLIFV